MAQLKETIKTHYEALEIPPAASLPTAPPLSIPEEPTFTPTTPEKPTFEIPTTIPQHFDHHHPLFRSISDFDIIKGTFPPFPPLKSPRIRCRHIWSLLQSFRQEILEYMCVEENSLLYSQRCFYN
jgi:hypothetical protein